MRHKVAEYATADKTNQSPSSCQSNRKPSDHSLIFCINQLKQPVLQIISSFLDRKYQPGPRSIQQSSKYHYLRAELKADLSKTKLHSQQNNQLQLAQRIDQVFGRRRFSYADSEDQHIERLNAKLDRYISRHLVDKQTDYDS